MRYSHMKSQLSKLIDSRNLALWLLVGSMTVNGVLAIVILSLVRYNFYHQRTYLVPPIIESSFWLSEHTLSPTYLSQMTSFFTQLRLNTTPASHEYQQEILLRYVEPKYFSILKEKLLLEADYFNEENLTTVFYPVAIEVDPEKFTSSISGDLHLLMEGELLEAKRITYEINYQYNQGRLWISYFQEKNHDE